MLQKKLTFLFRELKKQDLISSIMSSGKMTISKIVVTDLKIYVDN